VVTFVRTCDGDTSDFPIKIGLHQGSALSPFLFALVMDEVTRDTKDEIPHGFHHYTVNTIIRSKKYKERLLLMKAIHAI
jgi:hypothetical protein